MRLPLCQRERHSVKRLPLARATQEQVQRRPLSVWRPTRRRHWPTLHFSDGRRGTAPARAVGASQRGSTPAGPGGCRHGLEHSRAAGRRAKWPHGPVAGVGVIDQHAFGDPRCCNQVPAVVGGDCFRLGAAFRPASARRHLNHADRRGPALAARLHSRRPTFGGTAERACAMPRSGSLGSSLSRDRVRRDPSPARALRQPADAGSLYGWRALSALALVSPVIGEIIAGRAESTAETGCA